MLGEAARGEFEIVARRRPVDPLAAGTDVPCRPGAWTPLPRPAPYACVRADVSPHPPATERVELVLRSGADVLAAWWDPSSGAVGLQVTAGGRTTDHASRRWGHLTRRPDALALTLTGHHLTLLCLLDGEWQAHARHDLSDRVDVHAPQWCRGLEAGASTDPVLRGVTAGGFGQLGLRDLRLVTEADGTPVRSDGRLLLSATSAGPGFFDTAHTSLWALDPDSYALTHLSDLYFLRGGRGERQGSYGDHATHVVRDGERWLVATSTWGDFEPEKRPVRVVLAETTADLLVGEHLLEARELPLPCDGFRSVGVWDPHLLKDGEVWRVGYVSARKYFAFHPVLAHGPSLDDLTLTAAAPDRRATEGTTWVRLGGALRVVASDGPDSTKALRRRYPVFDTALREVGTLDAPYVSNLPWPTLVRVDDDWLMISFDGTPAGGQILGYGTHGDVVVMRTRSSTPHQPH